MPLTYKGSDDNALALVCAEFGLPAPGQRATRVEINAAAVAGGVDLDYQGSDRNAIELLYALLEALPSGPACSYQATYVLDNDGSLLMAMDWPNFNAGAQVMSFDDGDADAAYGAVPDFTQPGNGVLPMGAGVWPIFELGLTMPAAPSGGLIALGCMIISSDQTVIQGIKVTRNNSNAALLSTVLSGNYGQVHDDTAMSDFRVGIYINGDTGQVGYVLNGDDQGYFSGAPFAGKTGVIIAPIGDNLSDAFSGTAQIELITDPADMLMTPPCEV